MKQTSKNEGAVAAIPPVKPENYDEVQKLLYAHKFKQIEKMGMAAIPALQAEFAIACGERARPMPPRRRPTPPRVRPSPNLTVMMDIVKLVEKIQGNECLPWLFSYCGCRSEDAFRIVLNVLVKHGDAVTEMIKLPFNTAGAFTHQRYSELLWEIGTEKAADLLIPHINRKNEEFCKHAIEAVTEMKCKKAVPALLKLITDLNGPKPETVNLAIQGLGAIGGKEARKRLLEIVSDQEESFIFRGEAVDALGEIGSKSAIPALLEVLDFKVPADMKVIPHAIPALAKLGAKEAIPKLLSMLPEEVDTNDEDAMREFQLVVSALGKLRATEAIPKLVSLLSNYFEEVTGALIDLGAGSLIIDYLMLKLQNARITERFEIMEQIEEFMEVIGSDKRQSPRPTLNLDADDLGLRSKMASTLMRPSRLANAPVRTSTTVPKPAAKQPALIA